MDVLTFASEIVVPSVKEALAEPSKSELYLYAVPLFMAGRISLLSQPRLVDQFVGLRRKVLSGGREEVDHARGQHDDCANAVVGLAWRLFPPQPAVPLVAPIVVVGGQVLGAGPLTGQAAADATRRHVKDQIEQVHREASGGYAAGFSGGVAGVGWRRFDHPGGSW
jgi:hypothetical protein